MWDQSTAYYRARWSLEVVNDHNTSIVWEHQFETDRDADGAFRSALVTEGFEAFLDKD